MIKPKNKKTLLLGATILSALVGVSGAYIYNKTTFGDAVRLSLTDFAEGTNVSYQVISGGKVIGSGKAEITENGRLDLGVPKVAKTKGEVDYHLSIDQSGNEAEMLDLLLNVDKAAGKVSIKGDGFDAFSTLDIKNGQSSDSLTADWSGSVQTKIEGVLGADNPQSPIIEMALQSYGIESDLSSLKNGKVEIFLGEDLDYDLGDIRARFGSALNSMTVQLSAVMVQQTYMIGGFIDASIQLKTQRKIQELHARAHKDYHPSDQMCRFGTFMRSVAHTERKSEVDKYALNRILMNDYLGIENSTSATGPSVDAFALATRYEKLNCDPRDNGGAAKGICENKPDTQQARDQINKDVDYTRTLAGKLTLDVSFSDGDISTGANTLTDDEQNIMAMARNLYLPNVFESVEKSEIEKTTLMPHFDSRAWSAKMNVAHSSFVNIVGMKSSAPVGTPTAASAAAPPPAPFGTNVNTEITNTGTPVIQTPANTRSAPITTPPPPSQNATPTQPEPGSWRVLSEDSGWAYMKALLMEMGVVDENGDGNVHDEIDGVLGERPSYYAQMEVLTKKIYQSPNFYTNLYDKPANVERIGASIDAITLMNQRDRYESLLRQEMLTSLLVEESLSSHVEDVNTQIYEIMQKDQIRN